MDSQADRDTLSTTPITIDCTLSQMSKSSLIASCNHNGISYHGVLSVAPPADTFILHWNDLMYELFNQDTFFGNGLKVYERFPKNGYPLSHNHYTRSKRQKHIKTKIEPKKKINLKVKKETVIPKFTTPRQNGKKHLIERNTIFQEEEEIEVQEIEPPSSVSMKIARILGVNSEFKDDPRDGSVYKDCTPSLIKLGVGISKYLEEPPETYVAGVPVKKLKMEEYLEITNHDFDSKLTDIKRKKCRMKKIS